MGLDPDAGRLFVLRGRQGDRIKAIWRDGQGSGLVSKRLERGRVVWPAAAEGKIAPTPARAAPCPWRDGEDQPTVRGAGGPTKDWRGPTRAWRSLEAG